MDEGNGLLFMRARYDPATGRFISKDPIGWAGGLNSVWVCGNNPGIELIRKGLMRDSEEFLAPSIFMDFIQPDKTQVSVVTDIEVGGGFCVLL